MSGRPDPAVATRLAVADLLAEYVDCIDADELERWPGFFTDDAEYRITSAFNHRRGLPLGIIHAENRRMLEDRVAALREANVYERQTYRHIVSTARVSEGAAGLIAAEASFVVVRTMHDGAQALFASGRYLDRIRAESSGLRFASKLVVLDSDRIDTLLAIPL